MISDVEHLFIACYPSVCLLWKKYLFRYSVQFLIVLSVSFFFHTKLYEFLIYFGFPYFFDTKLYEFLIYFGYPYFFDTKLYEFLIYFGYPYVIGCIVCKYLVSFSRLTFCFTGGFHLCTKGF